jgi:hypothetical protein
LDEGEPPRLCHLTTGHVMLCPISQDAQLSFIPWHLQSGSGQDLIAQGSQSILSRNKVVHCQLSRTHLQFLPSTSPIAMLRLEWPEDVRQTDRYFDASTGAPLPHIMGSAGFRHHMALSALSALKPIVAAEHLPEAINAATDDALAWHYCRQLLAIAPESALPILLQLKAHQSANLRNLAAQTLAVLRTHYSKLFWAS